MELLVLQAAPLKYCILTELLTIILTNCQLYNLDDLNTSFHPISKRKPVKFLDFALKSAVLLLQLGFYLLLFSNTYHYSELASIDFVHFYTAGRIAAENGFENVYDLEMQKSVQAEVRGETVTDENMLPFNHPPFLTPLYYFATSFPYQTAYVLVFIVNLLLWIVCLGVLLQLSPNPIRESPNFWVWTVLFIGVFYLVFVSLLRGQDTVVLLLGVFLWVYGLVNEKDISAGFGLNLILIRPQIALVMILITLFFRRKAFLFFCGFALILALYSLILMKWEGVLGYLEMLLFSAGTVGSPIYQIGMLNLLGLLLRTFPGVNPQVFQSLAWIIYGVMIVGLCILWYRRREQLNWYLVGITVLLILVFSPHLHWHDLSLLVFPLLALALGKSTILPKVLVPYLIAGSSLILFISLFLSTQAYYTMPYFIIAGLFLMILFLDRDQRNVFNLQLPILQEKP